MLLCWQTIWRPFHFTKHEWVSFIDLNSISLAKLQFLNMAKTATVLDQGPLAPSGRWIWKDESNCLELISTNTGGEKQDKKKRNKGTDTGKRNDRVASSVANKSFGMGRMRNRAKSPRPQIKQTSDHTTVTLGDIKSVATDMLSEVERISNPFEGLYDTEQFDDFLMHLLSYFHCFFEKETLQNKPQDMYIEPSLSDKKAYAEACCKVEVALKLLGRSYCVLVLGLGLKHHHHMACGLSRVSSTYKDRSMYETFYSFCTFVVWIAFRRPDFEVVRKEIGRMLRSNTFNPAIRVKNAPEEPKPPSQPVEGQEEQVVEPVQPVPEKKITPAEYRRLHGKRPAIKSIINQRSPAIVSILPSPKEEAHWLFHKHHPAPPGTLGTDGDVDMNGEDILERLTVDKTTFKIGILGEPLGMFNSVTLSPLGAENEEEEQGEDGSGDTQADIGAGSNKSPTERVSRQQTAVSHTTTEAPDDE